MHPQSTRLLRTCIRCGDSFSLTRPSDRQRFCSTACWYIWNRRSLAERFWEKVDKDGPVLRPELGPCWVWTGTKLPRGYGHVWDIDRGRPIYSHRASWKLHYGPIPDGLKVLHHCDNPPCVRPDHLFIGTTVDNALDMARKGRNVAQRAALARLPHKGEANTQAKLSEADVREIRARYAAGVAIQQTLADEYGVTFQTISRVVRRQTWRHL